MIKTFQHKYLFINLIGRRLLNIRSSTPVACPLFTPAQFSVNTTDRPFNRSFFLLSGILSRDGICQKTTRDQRQIALAKDSCRFNSPEKFYKYFAVQNGSGAPATNISVRQKVRKTF